MAVLAWIVTALGVAAAHVPGNSSDSGVTVPVHSMHRLIPSVIDTESPRGNGSDLRPPGNFTMDTSPFLPSGVVPSFRNMAYQTSNNSIASSSKNFTPSFFIGEVIPEPYIPERYQTSRAGGGEKIMSNPPHQGLVPSQTAFAIRKILPFLEHMKHAAGYAHDDEHLDHAPPVHEPSMEDEELSTPKYAVNYQDQHSDRPSFPPHFQNFHSSKPIMFDNDGPDFQQDAPGYPPYGPRGNGHSHSAVSRPYSDQSDSYKYSHDHLVFNDTMPARDHGGPLSGPFFAHDNHDYDQRDHPDHFSHHDTDFVLPSPFYPPEPEHPPSHHKDLHYKVYQNKSPSPLHGLLHFAAALIPLGLFVAALQPSVIHVNSSQPMPAKHRSADGDSGREVLRLPGLEALERLGLGRLDSADCERRAFCELAVLGDTPEGNTAQQALWKLANSIPAQYAAVLGMDQVRKAVKAHSCSSLKCVDNKKKAEEKSSNFQTRSTTVT